MGYNPYHSYKGLILLDKTAFQGVKDFFIFEPT